MSELSPEEIAQARSLGYGLLADLLAHGPSPKTREAAETSEPLRAAFAAYAEAPPDTLAAEHQHAFGWAAPPFEGAHLDPERITGGQATDALWTLFGEAGFRPDVTRVDVEHLATGLRCLAFLSGAEADAIEDRHDGAVERVRTLSRRLLDEHLLRWVPVFTTAVRRLERPYPTALVEQLEALLLMHREQLPGGPQRFELPKAPALLEDESTGLREIGESLATPALSGVVLTREDIARLGRGARVPRGFGERTQLVVNLLRGAAQYDQLGALLGSLEAEIERHIDALEAPRYAFVAALTVPWRERADRTRALLAQMRAATFEAPTAGGGEPS